MSKELSFPDYAEFLTEVKDRILKARVTVGRAVNREMILLYWDIGQGIVEKQRTAGWGDAVVERLAADLRADFPDMRGLSANNLWLMRQMYMEYTTQEFLEQAVQELTRSRTPSLEQAVQQTATPSDRLIEQAVPGIETASCVGGKILAQVVRELMAPVPWGHHVEIMKKAKPPAARLYYLRATARFGWSRSVLLNQIKASAYERAVVEKKTHNFDLALPEYLAEQADEMLKSRYNLEFLGIHREVKERELENRLVTHLQRFILELGYGFCFIGRQSRAQRGNEDWN